MLKEWLRERWSARLEIVGRPPGSEGFVVLNKRWVVERKFAWMGATGDEQGLRVVDANERDVDVCDDDPADAEEVDQRDGMKPSRTPAEA